MSSSLPPLTPASEIATTLPQGHAAWGNRLRNEASCSTDTSCIRSEQRGHIRVRRDEPTTMNGFGQSLASLMPAHFTRLREPCSVPCAHTETDIEQNATLTNSVFMSRSKLTPESS